MVLGDGSLTLTGTRLRQASRPHGESALLTQHPLQAPSPACYSAGTCHWPLETEAPHYGDSGGWGTMGPNPMAYPLRPICDRAEAFLSQLEF